MTIVQPPKIFSQGEISKALEREIRTGFQLEREREKYRVQGAQKRADQFRGVKKVGELGRPVSVMPSRDFFRLVQKYGIQEVSSDKFIQYFQKKFPHLAPNKL